MYHEILPPCTNAQKEITCSNASLHPSEQFYMGCKLALEQVISFCAFVQGVEFRGTSAHFQSTFRALFKQLTRLC